uniref:Uncharacterized protein n=1 Tax=Calidris pygmaea TaxID=425635 RepID=A0A8C3PHR3_9CHAR
MAGPPRPSPHVSSPGGRAAVGGGAGPAMPKRSCPFGEAAPLHLKTRVGLRELSRGVRGEEYRREIFERTRRLLFRGAQAYMEGAWPASPAATCAVSRSPEAGGEAQESGAGRRWSGQLLIGHDGKLLRGPLATGKGEWPRRGPAEAGGGRCPAPWHMMGGGGGVCVCVSLCSSFLFSFFF